MTCRDCLHYDACVGADGMEYASEEAIKSDCPKFKNKADFVEVVRCKDCKHWGNKVFDPLFNKYIVECHCSRWENDYFYYETKATHFCSYGKRRDT